MVKRVEMLWPEELYVAVRGRVGGRGLTGFVLEAVRSRLEVPVEGSAERVADVVDLAVGDGDRDADGGGVVVDEDAVLPGGDGGFGGPFEEGVVAPDVPVGDLGDGVAVHAPIVAQPRPLRFDQCPRCRGFRTVQKLARRWWCLGCQELFTPGVG